MFYLNILRNSSGLIHVFIVLVKDTIVCRKECNICKVITNFWGFKDTETAGVNYATFRYHEHTNTDRLRRGRLCCMQCILCCFVLCFFCENRELYYLGYSSKIKMFCQLRVTKMLKNKELNTQNNKARKA